MKLLQNQRQRLQRNRDVGRWWQVTCWVIGMFVAMFAFLYLQAATVSLHITSSAILDINLGSFQETRQPTRARTGTHTEATQGQALANNITTAIHMQLRGSTAKDSQNQNSKSRFAYVWLLGGVHPDRPGYKGFLYTMLMSMHFLQNFNTTADFVVYVQLSPDNPSDALDAAETQYLQHYGATILYLPKPTAESFHQIVYEKLRPLELVQYNRIQFMDGDLIPLRSLDYIFHLSMGVHAILAPNVIHATGGEPCNAGWFMLAPHPGAMDQVQQVVAAQHEAARNLPYPKFDRVKGWGHAFAHDEWRGTRKNGTRWNFHAAHSDQGLLYYFVKYYLQDVTIVIDDVLQRWGPSSADGAHADSNHLPRLLDERPSAPVFDGWSTPDPRCRDDGRQQMMPECAAPYRDIAHFYGGAKPWGNKTPPRFGRAAIWYQGLQDINDKLQLHLDLSNWTALRESLKEPPLGRMAMWFDHAKQVEQRFNQTAQH